MSEQPLLDIEALRKIDAKPGDVFVLELPEQWAEPDDAEVERIGAKLKSVLGEQAKVIIPPPGAKLRSFRIDNATQRQLSVSVRVDEGMFFVVRVEEPSTANPSAVVSFQESPDADPATAEAIDRLRAKFLECYAGAVCVPSLKEVNEQHATGATEPQAGFGPPKLILCRGGRLDGSRIPEPAVPRVIFAVSPYQLYVRDGDVMQYQGECDINGHRLAMQTNINPDSAIGDLAPSLKEVNAAQTAGDSDVAALAEAADEPVVIERKDGTR